jgi:hypothetical protein
MRTCQARQHYAAPQQGKRAQVQVMEQLRHLRAIVLELPLS